MGSHLEMNDAREGKATDQEWLGDLLCWEERRGLVAHSQQKNHIDI